MLKVSVIVPIYNVEKYLGECLESLRQQSMQNCEFICIDDGSQDASYRIVEAYAERDKRFRLIRQENKGLAEARNVGLREAVGNYIAFLDSDDLLQGEKALDELYRRAEENQVDFLTFDADCFYESDLLRKTDNRDSYYIRKKEYGFFSTGRELFCTLMENDDFCDGAGVLFFRRDWMMANDLWFTPGLCPEDCIWSFFCYMRAGKVEHIKNRYYKYRIRSHSITTGKVSFDVIYGRIYTVKQILRFALTDGLAGREEKAVCKFLDIILWHIKDKYLQLEISEAYRAGELSPLERLMAVYADVDDFGFNHLIYMRGFKSILQEAPGIIIYGAGRMGKLIYHYMQKEGIEGSFLGFAVSKITSEEMCKEYGGLHTIYDRRWSKDSLVVVAVFSEACRKEMTAEARAAGFASILPADTYLLRILEEHYG